MAHAKQLINSYCSTHTRTMKCTTAHGKYLSLLCSSIKLGNIWADIEGRGGFYLLAPCRVKRDEFGC
eukprot:617682-Amphidinium_carterae.1